HALTMRWDGGTWNSVPAPDAGTRSDLYGLAAITGSDIWAVGSANTGARPARTLAIHWDGGSWSISPSSDPATFGNQLLGVAAASGNDILAVGSYSTEPGSTQSNTLAE